MSDPGARMGGMSIAEHDQTPAEPADGDTFTCSRCGDTATFVVLDDGLPGEWVWA